MNARHPLVLVVTAVLLTLGALEVVVRLVGLERTYSEKTRGRYATYYGKSDPTWYHTLPSSTTGVTETREFSFPYRTNSLGFKEREIPPRADNGPALILVLGDSFAEGVGAPPAESWPRELERIITEERGPGYTVYNAGISGSDPFFEQVLLRDRLLALKPELVVIAVNGSDLDDFVFRGGEERFIPDGSTRYRSEPAIEPLYHHSHLARLILRFLGYQHTLLRKEAVVRQYREAALRIGDLLIRCRDLCASKGARLLVVVHALPNEFRKPAPQPPPPPGAAGSESPLRPLLKRVVRALGLAPTRGLDHQSHLEALIERLRRNGLPCVNLSPALQEALGAGSFSDYAWPVDGHFNARGYAIFARTLWEELEGFPELLPSPGAPRR